VTTTPSTPPGRPPVTSHAAIEAAAFRLFAERGFDETTVDEIAEAAGIGRRTLFRYFPSKYDIPWGQFDASLLAFRRMLEEMPASMPLWEAVHRGVVAFNTLAPENVEQHRQRMRLILGTPGLQAHSFLMYEHWRGVIVDFVAARCGVAADHPLPVTAGHVSLALALAAYDRWLSTDVALDVALDESMATLRSFLELDARHDAHV
jgi:mycofactocin system transcriptional regulator